MPRFRAGSCPSPVSRRSALSGLLTLVGLLMVSCSDSAKSPPSPTIESGTTLPSAETSPPSPTPTATTKAIPASTPPSGGGQSSLAPAPGVGIPCPVQVDLCTVALRYLEGFAARDFAELLGNASPREYVCPPPAQNSGIGNTRAICADAKAGDRKVGYRVLQGGEGSVVSETTFRSGLADLTAKIPPAATNRSDAWGPGNLRIASVGCLRAAGAPAASCSDSWARSTFTWIDPQGPADRQRQVLCLDLRKNAKGNWGVFGYGCPVPPYAALYASDSPAQADDGTPGTFSVYPWTPPGAVAFGNGVHLVGSQIPAGTYRTRRVSLHCTWLRLSIARATLATEITDSTVVVAILPEDGSFTSEDCAPFTSDLSPITTDPAAPFRGGTYIVNVDISPGTWRSDGTGNCYWARLRSFTGDGPTDIVADAHTTAPATVTIAATDKGFKTNHDCSTWTKVG